MAEGTQTRTRARLRRLTPTWWSSTLIMRSVRSKSVMAPWRMGRSATMYPGVRPIICQASSPMARTSRERLLSATTVGSFNTMPRPRSNTKVLAVPRSMARSRGIPPSWYGPGDLLPLLVVGNLAP